MGRSVATHHEAAATVYLGLDTEETHEFEWQDELDWIYGTIHGHFKSFNRTGRWEGRELFAICENDHAFVTVSEYCGLVAVCLVPRGGPLADAWCRLVTSAFEKLFPGRLNCIGRASNGEAFYVAANQE